MTDDRGIEIMDNEGNPVYTKDLLDEVKRLRRYEKVLLDLHAGLFPESYPPGHPQHDPQHEYWDGADLPPTREELDNLDNGDLYERAYMVLPNDRMSPIDQRLPDHEDDFTDEHRELLIKETLAWYDASEAEPYQWDSGTIEWVASDIATAISNNPLANTAD
jgi:hypothetical protein